MPDLTATQFNVLLRVKKLIDAGEATATRRLLFDGGLKDTMHSTKDVTTVLKQLAYKGLIVARRTQGYVLTTSGRETIADPTKASPKGHKVKRRFAACAACGDVAEVWLMARKYVCRECLNEDDHKVSIDDFIWRRADDADYSVTRSHRKGVPG